MIKRRVNLKITSASRETIRLAARTLTLRCAACACEVETISEADAVGILRVDAAALGGLVAAGQVHSIPTVSGSHWICKNSLLTPGND